MNQRNQEPRRGTPARRWLPTALPTTPSVAHAVRLVCALLASATAAPLSFAQPEAPASAPARTAGNKARGAAVTLNFVNADIDAVTRAVGAMLDRQILVDPRVKGTVTLYSEQPLSTREAYLNYISALRGLGFTVIETGGLLKVVPEADAKLQTGTVSVGAVPRTGDQVITQIFRLTHENANNLVAVLRPLISANNTINANPGNNTLVITDYADNLSRLAKIIAAMDTPAANDVEVIPLQYALAADLAPLIQKLTESGTPSGGVPGVGVTGGVSLLTDSRSNSLIVRASNPARMAQVKLLVDKLDKPTSGNGSLGNIYVVYLKNADAVRLAQVLRAAYGAGGSGGSGGSSGGGSTSSGSPTNPLSSLNSGSGSNSGGASTAATTPVSQQQAPSTGGFVQAEPATNSLIITAPEPLYRQLRAVIDQLDARRAQVYIESMIVKMDATKAAEFGFQWQGLLGKNGDRVGLVGGTNFGTGGNNIITLATSSVGSAVPGSGLNVGLLQKINGVYTLGALARFLESNTDANVLSTPNLVTLDNEEAKIVIGQNVPFITGTFTSTGSTNGTVNPFQTVERKDVGLTLRVKPQIGEGGTVRMTIYQENSSVVPGTSSSTAGPTTDKSSIEATVVVDDGQIMVLGGLLKDDFSNGKDKVPVLGDVPVVGALFRSETRTRIKSNLMVFLRPVVMRTAQASEALSLDRYEMIRSQQVDGQPAPSIVMKVNEAPVLPVVPLRNGNVPSVPAQPGYVDPVRPGADVQVVPVMPAASAPVGTP